MLSSLTAATIFNPLLEIPTSPGRCPSYDCLQPSHVTDFYSTCLIYNASALTYSSLSCNNYFLLNNFCDTSSLDLKNSSTYTVRCTPPSLNYTNLYPGEGPCFKNKNCVSQICENYVCQGVEISSPCNYTYQCEQGLVCEGMDPSLNETGTCSFALRPGHGLCTSDFDCVNNAGCDRNGENDGLCRPYFSIPVGGEVLTCANHVSMVCETATCNTLANGTSVCIYPYNSTHKNPIPCSTGQECIDASKQVYSACICGMNNEAQAYCGPMPGDPVALGLIQVLKKWTQSLTILACSSERRWSLECMKNWQPELYDAVKEMMLQYMNFTSIVDNEECTKEIFTYMYWDAVSDVKIDQKTAGGVAAVIFTIFLVI